MKIEVHPNLLPLERKYKQGNSRKKVSCDCPMAKTKKANKSMSNETEEFIDFFQASLAFPNFLFIQRKQIQDKIKLEKNEKFP